MLDTLPEELQQYAFFEVLTALPFVKTIYLYGSRARRDHNSRSDIDLAVRYIDEKPIYRAAVQGILDNADTLLKIDCVDLDPVSGPLKEAIEQEGLRLHG